MIRILLSGLLARVPGAHGHPEAYRHEQAMSFTARTLVRALPRSPS